MIQEAIQQLISGADLSREQARAVMDQIMSGGATHAQIGAFLVALRIKGETVDEIAESMIEEGQRTAIMVREDGARMVLVEGLHRLEACKALGEETIIGVVVQARAH